jgi:hypothetical protein
LKNPYGTHISVGSNLSHQTARVAITIVKAKRQKRCFLLSNLQTPEFYFYIVSKCIDLNKASVDYRWGYEYVCGCGWLLCPNVNPDTHSTREQKSCLTEQINPGR